MIAKIGVINGAKRYVRKRLITPLQNRLAARQVQRFVASFRKGNLPDAAAIRRLRRAWGNEAFSADADYIGHVIAQAQRSSGPLLECGTGLTTLIAALLCEKRDEIVWCLEQDANWGGFVQERLKVNDIKNVNIIHAPLKDYGDFVWYDLGCLELPASFGLVLCDGPFISTQWGRSHLQWRYGLAPTLLSRNICVDAILLDDVDIENEPRAKALLERWTSEFGFEQTTFSSSLGSCALLRPPHLGNLGDAARTLRRP